MKLNKFFVLTCLLVVALVSGAAAQTNWKGLYVGGNVGAAWDSSDAHTFPVFSPTGYFATTSPGAIAVAGTQHLDATGVTGGGQLGYNFQHGSWVIGVEADFGAMDLSDARSSTGTYPCCAPTGFTVRQSLRTSWLFTARPRLGYAAGKFLLYGTGGLALTNINYQSVFTDTFATAHENGGVAQNQTGWVAGGGVEYQVADHWSFKGEFLHADFGNVFNHSTNLTAFSPPIAFPTNVFTHTADLSGNVARFGVNYRF